MPTRPERTLLLVDDDPLNLLALDALLSGHGHRLLHANDGDAALELFDTEAPDIVLCDLKMPGMDGVEVLGRIRAHPERNHTPVIMITGYGDRGHRLRALRAGADEFLEKPLDEALLAARLNTLLLLKQSRDQLASRHAALQRAQKEQGELMDFIVQDVAGSVRLLEETLDDLGERIGEHVEGASYIIAGMQSTIERLRMKVDDLWWVTRLDTCNIPVRRSRVVLNDVIEESVRRIADMAVGQEVDIDVVFDERVEAQADRRLLGRVLDNLLDNALRYAADHGRVLVELHRDRGAEIRVYNDGPQIPPNERTAIFEKFVRGQTDPPSPGHPGLGLYFCKRAIDAHQGEIRCIDRPGWPTCFSVWLPDPI